MVDSEPNWLDDLYKYDDVTFISTCCDALPTYEDVEIDHDKVAFGYCSKCNEWSDFYDENE